MRSRGLIVVGVVAAAVVLMIISLAVKVSSDPEVALDEDKLAQARAYHQQLERQRASAQPPSSPAESDWRDDVAEPTASARSAPERANRDEGVVRVDPRPRFAGRSAEPRQLEPADDDQSLPARMDNANSLYDKADYEASREAALEVLEEDPNNVRMLRIAVSSSCIMAEPEVAEQFFARLEKPRDRRQMATRCERYGVQLEP